MPSNSERSAGLLHALARPFVVGVERWMPDPIVFVIALTALAFLAALFATDSTPTQAIEAWGGGLSSLLAFIAQLSITLVSAHALARTEAADRALMAVSQIPSSPRAAYALVSLVSSLASLVAWPLGLVAGATVARRVAIATARRGVIVDYPLLVASAYAGFVVWHMGYSGSAPLFVATPGHALEATLGVIPVSQTILASWNLVIAAIAIAAVAWTCSAMAPPDADARRIDPLLLAEDESEEEAEEFEPDSLGDRLGNSRVGSFALGALFLAYLVAWFVRHGVNLNLDIVNWTFVTAGLLLARSPVHYVSLAVEGGRSIGSLLVQYPLYAGIMGLMSGTGLVHRLSDAVAASADATTLPLWAFFSGGIVNLFVPSGGGQWAVQGPIFVEAAQALSADPALIVMSIAYGDQWTNLIQPFWTIPLLAIAGLHVRDVLGYTFVVLGITGVIFAGGLVLVSHGVLP